MQKKLLSQIYISILLGVGSVAYPQEALALNLRDYIAGPNFVPHNLSTGEYVYFAQTGHPQGIRQYKNDNYEQFIYKGDGIYRREDTSWAPLAGYMEAACPTGNRAGYTLVSGCQTYPNGSTITNEGGIRWAPNEANIGDTWNTEPHQIVPIDTGIPLGEYAPMSIPPLIACTVPALPEYNGTNACNSVQTIQLAQKYGPNEFTFCTGATNPEEMIVLKVVGGPGTGDTFYYMKGWGLVGFKTDGLGTLFESGLADGPGVEVGKMHAPDCTIVGNFKPKEPRTIVGRVTRAPVTLVNKGGKTVEVAHHPIRNARICVYEGLRDGKVQGIGDTIKRLVATTTTDEDGYFRVDTDLLSGGNAPSYNHGNFVAIFCGQQAEILWTSIYMPTWEPLPIKYWKNDTIRALIQAKVPLKPNGTGKYPYDYNFKMNKEIVLPLEVELNCPVEPGQPHWNPEAEHPWQRPGYRYDDETEEIPECPEELAYVDRSGYSRAGWYDGLELGKKTEVPMIFHAEIKFGEDDKYLGEPWNRVAEGADEDGRKRALPEQRPEGWFNLAGAMSSLEEATAKITSFVFGGFTEPDFWPTNKAEDENTAMFYDCEDIREANTVTGELNPQKNAGLLSLMPPIIDKPENHTKPLYQVSPQRAYKAMDKHTKICHSDEYGEIELKDIQPPSKDYLPEDEQYRYCNPEVDEGCEFKLSWKYFPYFRVMKLGLTPREGPMQRAWEEADDSYVPDTAGRREQPYDHNPGEDETGKGYRTETKILSPSRRDNDFNATLAQVSTDPESSLINLILPPAAKNSAIPRPHGMAKTVIYKGLDKNVTSQLDGHNENFYERYSVDSYSEGSEGLNGTAGIYDIKMAEINGEKDDGDSPGEEKFLGDTHRKTSAFSRIIQAIFNLFESCKQESDTDEEICTEEDLASEDVECLPRLDPRGCEEEDDVECRPAGCEEDPDVDCTVVYVKPKTVYGCTGHVDPVKMDIADKLKIPDISSASDTVDRAAAALLPPGVAEKIREEANICVYDQYMEMTGTTGELESLEGKDIPCSKAPSLINPLKKAISPPTATID